MFDMLTESRFPVIDVKMFYNVLYKTRQQAEETIPTIPTLIWVGFLPSRLCCKDDTFSFFVWEMTCQYVTEMSIFFQDNHFKIEYTIASGIGC